MPYHIVFVRAFLHSESFTADAEWALRQENWAPLQLNGKASLSVVAFHVSLKPEDKTRPSVELDPSQQAFLSFHREVVSCVQQFGVIVG